MHNNHHCTGETLCQGWGGTCTHCPALHCHERKSWWHQQSNPCGRDGSNHLPAQKSPLILLGAFYSYNMHYMEGYKKLFSFIEVVFLKHNKPTKKTQLSAVITKLYTCSCWTFCLIVLFCIIVAIFIVIAIEVCMQCHVCVYAILKGCDFTMYQWWPSILKSNDLIK